MLGLPSLIPEISPLTYGKPVFPDDYECTAHDLSTSQVNNLCDNGHSHSTIPGGFDRAYSHSHSHRHRVNHSHAHNHSGEHNHSHFPSKNYYDQTEIKRKTLPGGSTSNFPNSSSRYNDIDNITLLDSDFEAKYVLDKNGTDIEVTIWTKSDIMNNVYPDKGIAKKWHDQFKATYKEKWMYKNAGIRVSKGIVANKGQTLKLFDGDGCLHTTFNIKVEAPKFADFDTANITVPTGACKTDGTAEIIYKSGGHPPYTHSPGGTLSSPGERITVGGLKYGDNEVKLNYGSSTESTTVKIRIGSTTQGITSTPVKPQTCPSPNGSIKIIVGSIPGEKTFRLINQDNPDLKYEQKTGAGSWTCDTLPAGTYKAIVEAKSCNQREGFSKEGIVVKDSIFRINKPVVSDVATIGGTGKVEFTFENRVKPVYWNSCTPSLFEGTSVDADYKDYPGIAPRKYTFEARHTDKYNRDCIIRGNFEIKQPSFNAEINLHENEDSIMITVNFKNGNTLILPYRFRLLNNSGGELETGIENSSFSATVKTTGTYTINLVYGTGNNNIDIHTFKYPSSPITSGHSISVPIKCPGGATTMAISPEGGLGDKNFTASTDGVSYAPQTSFTVDGGDFEFYIKDTLHIPDKDVGGNPVIVKHDLKYYFSVDVDEPKPVGASIIKSVDVSCAGKNDGSVSIANVKGGSGLYRFWVEGYQAKDDTLEQITGLPPGEHTLYLKDRGNNCQVVSLAQFNIIEPDTLKIDSIRITQPKCELENGDIYMEVKGGNGYYQFDWEYEGSPFYSSGSLEQDTISHLSDTLKHGFYSLTVTDNNKCELNYSTGLKEYINPQIDSIDITTANCYGESNGLVQVIDVSGTTNIDQFAIKGLEFIHNDTIDTIANPFTGLAAGKYEITLTDDSACYSDSPYPLVVGQPDTILYAVIDTIVPVLGKGTATGQIHGMVYGGNKGVKDISLLDSDLTAVEQKNGLSGFPVDFKKLYAGEYTLQISDAKGCAYTSPVQQVVEPESALGFIVTEKNNALCKAQAGSFTVEAFGGWGDYSYKRAQDNAYYPVNTFKNLYAGSYMVSVRDKYGAIFTDTVVIYEPKDSLQARIIESTAPTCGDNGSLLLNVKGGTAPYKLSFDGSSDTSNLSLPQNYTFANRPSGGYALMLIDDNGCPFTLETQLPDTGLLAIDEFKLVYPSTRSSADGSIEAIVHGGKEPLGFEWRELFGSTLAETSSSLSNVPSGHYGLMVSEAGGCSKTGRVYLPAAIDLALEIVELQHESSYQAQNGFAHLKAGLDSIIEVEIINPGNIRTVYNISDSTTEFYEQNQHLFFKNLTGGAYFVSAVSKHGQKAFAEFDIKKYDEFYFKDTRLSHAKQPGDTSGAIHVVVAGGAGENSFSWEYLGGVATLNPVDNEYTSTLSRLEAGNYRITVTDKYNNVISQTIEVEEPGAPLEITIAEYRNESCKDYEDAYVILQATGGWGEYQFRQDVAQYYSNSDTWINLDVREHYFYLTDKAGITDSIAITITEPDYLRAVTEFIDSVNCKNAADGNAFFDITGGTKPYRLVQFEPVPGLWLEDTVARNLREGNYTYIFTDSNDCIGQDTVSIYMPEPDSLLFNNINITHTTCGTDNGAIAVVMQGGTKPYRYQWADFGGNPIGIESSVSGLSQNGYYFLNVLDAHDCPQSYEQLIKPSTNPVVLDVDTTPVLCYGGHTGTAHVVGVQPAEPFAPYTFTWSNDDTGDSATGYNAGVHSVTILDTNNCSTVKYFEVTQPDSLQIVLIDSKDAHCYGYNDGFIDLQAQGGVGNYRFEWSNGDTSHRAEELYTGNYDVTVSDSNECSASQAYHIYEPPKLIVDLGEDIRICPGNSIDIDGQEFASHQWSDSDGVISDERFITLEAEGDYFLEVTDSIGCFARDTIKLSIGNDALQADFLMTSGATLNDTLYIYEISNMVLDSLAWDYSPLAFNDITPEEVPEYMLHLESLQPGIYNVSLMGYSGGCVSVAIKQVEIIEGNDTINDYEFLGYKDPLIKELKAVPNPTNGNFRVEVELREEADIQLVIFSINYGKVIDLRKEYGLKYYEVNYQLNKINSGIYVISVTAKKERKQIKIVVE